MTGSTEAAPAVAAGTRTVGMPDAHSRKLQEVSSRPAERRGGAPSDRESGAADYDSAQREEADYVDVEALRKEDSGEESMDDYVKRRDEKPPAVDLDALHGMAPDDMTAEQYAAWRQNGGGEDDDPFTDPLPKKPPLASQSVGDEVEWNSSEVQRIGELQQNYQVFATDLQAYAQRRAAFERVKDQLDPAAASAVGYDLREDEAALRAAYESLEKTAAPLVQKTMAHQAGQAQKAHEAECGKVTAAFPDFNGIKLKNYLGYVGYSDGELASARVDARQVIMAEKARRWDEAEAIAAAKRIPKPARRAPKVTEEATFAGKPASQVTESDIEKMSMDEYAAARADGGPLSRDALQAQAEARLNVEMAKASGARRKGAAETERRREREYQKARRERRRLWT